MGLPDWYVANIFMGQKEGIWTIAEWASLSGFANWIYGEATIGAGDSSYIFSYRTPADKRLFITAIVVSAERPGIPFRAVLRNLTYDIDYIVVASDRAIVISTAVPLVIGPDQYVAIEVTNLGSETAAFHGTIFGFEF